jgi:hypothetical protein
MHPVLSFRIGQVLTTRRKGRCPDMGLTSPTTNGRADDRLVARRSLMAAGLTAEESAYWCATWEGEAGRQNIPEDRPYFWHAGRGWIDAQRAIRKVRAP